MATSTIEVNPAAGPLTLNDDPLNDPTTIPPIIPAIKPENKGAPDAKAIPKHKGKATRKTTTEDGKSVDQKFLKFIKRKKIKLKLKHPFRVKAKSVYACGGGEIISRKWKSVRKWPARESFCELMLPAVFAWPESNLEFSSSSDMSSSTGEGTCCVSVSSARSAHSIALAFLIEVVMVLADTKISKQKIATYEKTIFTIRGWQI
jgi:hypothetical protein